MRRLDNIDIRLLRVFVALVDANGFADAQLALNLSQSTLSTHLAELEKRIGGQLCHRGRKQFRLTELGQATYDAAMKLFRDLDDFTQRVSAASGNLSGRLRLGASDGIMTSEDLGLQRAIAEFSKPDADIFIDLELGTPSDLEQRVADGDRDIAIGPFSQRSPGLVYRDYAREPHNLYCGRRHVLFNKSNHDIDQRDLSAARFSVRRYRHFDDLYLVGHPRASASVVAMEAQAMLVLSGQFIGFLPCHFASPWVERGEMRAIRPNTFGFTSTHKIAYRRDNQDSPLIKRFLSILAATGRSVEAGAGA